MLFEAAAITAPALAQDANSCSTSGDCAAGEFCDTTPKCPGNGVKGVCRRKPEV